MAVIFDTDKCFLHIPKTGGMWVRFLLSVNGIMPTVWSIGPEGDMPDTVEVKIIQNNARHHLAVRPPGISKVNTFCVLRDPVSWHQSFWLFRNYSKKWRWNRKKRVLDSLLSDDAWKDFNTYVEEMVFLFPQGFLNAVYLRYMEEAGRTCRIKNAPKLIERMTGHPMKKLPDPINTRDGTFTIDSFTISKILEWEAAAGEMYNAT